MKSKYLIPFMLVLLASVAIGMLIYSGRPFNIFTSSSNKKLDGKMTLRLELFTDDMEATVNFYKNVLGFQSLKKSTNTYQPIRRGEVILGIGLLKSLGDDHYFEPNEPTTKFGYGLEIVLEVDNIHSIYNKVKSSGVKILANLKKQPWGLTDFRLTDPNGYYVRVTSKH